MGGFFDSVYSLTKKIPNGKVGTYSGIARALGKPKAARAVGNALNANRDLESVPCYRVVKADGRVGGYAKGSAAKKRLLERDGLEVKNGRVAGFSKHLYNFKR